MRRFRIPGAAILEVIAGPLATGTAAETDVGGRTETGRVRGVEAGRPAVVHSACSAADALGARGAVRDHDALAGVFVANTMLDRSADEGELCVGRSEPGEHSCLAHNSRGELSTSKSIIEW